MRAGRARDERGVTLVELLAALVIVGMVASAALSFVQQQDVAFALGTGRMDVLRNARFAGDLLERNLRTLGNGVSDGQPALVYADSATLAFNADYLTNDPGDGFAVYLNPSAPAAEVGALTRARRMRIPGTSFDYPDVSYGEGGVNSPAETIVLRFAPDATTPAPSDYVLLRRVNDLPEEVVARHLERTPGVPFFEYQEVVGSDTTLTEARWVPRAALPLRHRVAVHLAAADTGRDAAIDRVRAVRVSFTATSGSGAGYRQSRPFRRLVRIPNAGLGKVRTCGDAPVFTAAVGATALAPEGRIDVTWAPSADETGGERDVVRYVIYRREPPAADWGDPYFSVPAGRPGYLFSDRVVSAGTSYEYAIAAQDCTPSTSQVRTSPTVTLP